MHSFKNSRIWLGRHTEDRPGALSLIEDNSKFQHPLTLEFPIANFTVAVGLAFPLRMMVGEESVWWCWLLLYCRHQGRLLKIVCGVWVCGFLRGFCARVKP